MFAAEHGPEGVCLPGRAEAEQAIAELIAGGQLAFVLVIVAKHLHRVYEQDGYAAGDRLLESLARRLSAQPSSDSRLYHWSATSFVVTSQSLRTITDCTQVEDACCALFGIWPHDQPRALYDRIDQYIATHLAYAA